MMNEMVLLFLNHWGRHLLHTYACYLFKLRQGASSTRFVGLSVGRPVCPYVKKNQKILKSLNYQNYVNKSCSFR